MDVRQGFQVAPGQCFTCRTSDPKAWVIDTGQDHPEVVRRHRIYICSGCVLAMAKMLTPHTDVLLVSADALQVMHGTTAQAEAWRERAEAAEGKLAELASFVNAGAV